MPSDVAHDVPFRAAAARWRLPWSMKRRVISVVVVLLTATVAGLFAWRASITPLRLWTNASQCAADPNGNVGSIFGLAFSPELRGASQIKIVNIETPGSSGAQPPSF